LAQFHSEVNAFCSQEGYRVDAEYHTTRRASNQFLALFNQVPQGVPLDRIVKVFDEALRATTEAVRAIPADEGDVIIPAGSPFSAFLQISARMAMQGIQCLPRT